MIRAVLGEGDDAWRQGAIPGELHPGPAGDDQQVAGKRGGRSPVPGVRRPEFVACMICQRAVTA